MANLFEGASKLKNEAEEIDKILEKLKLTSERLEKIEINGDYLKFVQYILWQSYPNKAVLKNLYVLILA